MHLSIRTLLQHYFPYLTACPLDLSFGAAHAWRRRLDRSLGLIPLGRRLGDDGERMDRACKLLLQHRIDQSVPREQSLALKRVGDHDNLEVGLGATGHVVAVGFVEHLEERGLERGVQLRAYRLRHRACASSGAPGCRHAPRNLSRLLSR